MIKFPSAISHPKKSIHIRLSRNENTPLPYTTSLPNGQNASDANLKHCTPTGMPMIVTHHRQPARIQAKPPIMPPNINHKIFPNVFIIIIRLSECFCIVIFVYGFRIEQIPKSSYKLLICTFITIFSRSSHITSRKLFIITNIDYIIIRHV